MFQTRPTDDERLVTAAMRELEQTAPSRTPLPDPSFIWWKAQLLRRLEAEREAIAPLEIGDRVHVGAAVLGALALAAGAWDQLPSLSLSVGSGLAVALALALVLTVAALAAIDALRER